MASRASEIVQSLGNELTSAQVFEAFAELDRLPAEEVRAALAPLTGPAPDPEALDDSVRIVHGFPLAPVAMRCTVRLAPIRVDALSLVQREQVVKAGKQWDGVELDVSGRISDPVFSDSLEMRTFADAKGKPVFDVVLHGDGGTVFQAGTSIAIGAIAYGMVEMRDRARRLGLGKAIVESDSMAKTAPVLLPIETPSSGAPTMRFAPDDEDDGATVVMPGRYDADPRVIASQADTQVMDVVAPAPPRAPAKKKAAAKKKAVEVEVEEEVVEAKPKAAKKATAKKAAPKKKATAAKKATTTKKKAAAAAPKKKAAAKKTATKKTAGAAKKKTAVKKTAVKKTAGAAKKKAATKKTAAAAKKKTATAKKAKAPAKKKTAAKKRA